MKVLIDTNVFIHREYDRIIPESLQHLERTLQEQGSHLYVHPLSKQEIWNDRDAERREKASSKIETYPELSFTEYPRKGDVYFRNQVPPADSFNERVDNALLFSVYRDQVDFLITEDRGIHQKALNLGIDDRVFTIDGGREFFKEEPSEIRSPPSIQRVTLSDIDPDDPIFDSIKEDYPGFEEWLLSHPDRSAWIHENPDGTLGAILILKYPDTEPLGVNEELPKKPRLKISTLKVGATSQGSKIGELFIWLAVNRAIEQNLEEVYLTRYEQENDYLVDLISQYGFSHEASEADGESIFLKRLVPGPGDDPEPIEMSKRFYPSLKDGENIQKFLVPIRPIWHDRLFTSSSERQSRLEEYLGQFLAEGNAIKKAFLSKSRTKKIRPGDLLLFYRSQDAQAVTSIGVCEQVLNNMDDPDDIHRVVGRRSVFSDEEISERASQNIMVILFRWHFDLENPVGYHDLLGEGIISAPFQGIIEIEHNGYKYIKEEGGMDERFTFN